MKKTKLFVMKKILQNIITAIILSLALLVMGLAIWYFMKESETSLQDILFYVGAAPIVIFSIGQLGNFFGRGDPSYQLSRSVSNQSSGQKAFQDVSDIESKVKSGLNWIIAGLLVWLYSSFL
jgi:hypothetical protein